MFQSRFINAPMTKGRCTAGIEILDLRFMILGYVLNCVVDEGEPFPPGETVESSFQCRAQAFDRGGSPKPGRPGHYLGGG
jgi:hypothetical protein